MPHLAGALRFIEYILSSHSQVLDGVYYFSCCNKVYNKNNLRKVLCWLTAQGDLLQYGGEAMAAYGPWQSGYRLK